MEGTHWDIYQLYRITTPPSLLLPFPFPKLVGISYPKQSASMASFAKMEPSEQREHLFAVQHMWGSITSRCQGNNCCPMYDGCLIAIIARRYSLSLFGDHLKQFYEGLEDNWQNRMMYIYIKIWNLHHHVRGVPFSGVGDNYGIYKYRTSV